ncbi:hypothetical protein QQS45_01260 [Alteriqipengyuania flavescens]|uniref:hypothetical protein n=1 Tax=Alteriqipengyuania flavescens TaxID=3053610 RepID=UPI0025B29602|nr:hypothetical protein [Alteriqipengyuania flavescens]WJY18906.1 hypothetical protein QQW98_01260 [Alteriqipengyuania flavescens]WJY24846.1 hypothetical protein QQS45_01260 [Alteriqipengyuania flavescens]
MPASRLAAAACAAAALATPAAAMAENWWYVTDDGSTIGYIDVDSVSGSQANRAALILIAQDKGSGLEFMEAEIILHCDTREWKLYSMTVIDGYGSVVASEVLDLPPEPIRDGSPGADYEAYMCDGDKSGMADIGDPYAKSAELMG